MRVLVVGAGTVGQVFGRHLALGGAEVSFLVREKYAPDCRRGFTLYPLNRPRRQRLAPVRFEGAGVLTDIAAVAAQRWDQVYVTVSSTALRAGWFSALAGALGDATVVLLQTGPGDRDYALAYVPEERLVHGLIGLIGYAAPLPGEKRFPQPGVAYWFPPLTPSPMSGPRGRRDAVVAALRAGRLPARVDNDVARVSALPAAAFIPMLLYLEAAGWSFARAFRGATVDRRLLATAFGAGRQAMAVMAGGGQHTRRALLAALLRPIPFRLLIALAGAVVPLDVEAYLRVHFTKVGDQSRLFLQRYVELGRKAGLSVTALETIQRAVDHPT